MTSLRNRKRSSQGSKASQEIELPPYTTAKPTSSSPTTTSRDGFFPDPTETETEISHPEPPYTQKLLSTSPDFTTLLVSNDGWLNITLSLPSNPDIPLFSIINSQFSLSSPSVTMFRGAREAREKGCVAGVLNLLWSRDNVFCLGDPDALLLGEGEGESDNVRDRKREAGWENLRRTSKWTHAVYEFSWGVGRERKTYVWRRTRAPIFGDQPDLELREVWKEAGEGVVEGRVLAAYKGRQSCLASLGKKRGEFYVRRNEGEEWGDWEKVVLLTGFGIIEGSRRRARQRNKAV